MADLEHLHPDVRQYLQYSREERINYIWQTHWIGYGRATEALNTLSDLLARPKTLRMPNLLLVADSDNGKSTIVNEFRERNPATPCEGDQSRIPVVVMDMPSEPSETRFWTALMSAICLAHRDTDPVIRKQEQALSTLRYLRVGMLVIDEIHNLLFGGVRQQRHFLGVLKNLSNDLKIPLVCCGTRESIRAFQTDAQVASRFQAFGLPKWKLDMEFRKLLVNFERQIPLAEPSHLADDRDLAIRIHSRSRGTIGGVAGVLKQAAVSAIRAGREKIDIKAIDSVEHVSVAEFGRRAAEE